MAYKPYKMKGHTLPGIKQNPSSPYKDVGIFKDVLDEVTGETKQVRISDEESKGISHTRTGEDIKLGPSFSKKQKRANIERMKKKGTYKADVKAQKKVEKEYAAKQALAKEEGSAASSSPATSKSSPAKLPIAAIPAIISAAGAVGGMMKKKEES